jgi:hypothetical protein
MLGTFLPLLQLLLVAIVLIWNVVLAARIAQVRTLPREFVALSALAGFLVVPALLIHLATTSSITGRALTAVDWIWPFTVVLFAIQALYAASRRFVNPFLGFFIATYDILIAVDAVLRFVASRGTPLPGVALIFLAATTATFTYVTQSPLILGSPFFFFTPMIAPAFPALRRAAATFRIGLALVAGLYLIIFVTRLTPADQAVNSYGIHDPRVERLQERPEGDFEVGLKVFEDMDGPPATLAVRNDLALADTMGVAVINVVIVPEAMDRAQRQYPGRGHPGLRELARAAAGPHLQRRPAPAHDRRGDAPSPAGHSHPGAGSLWRRHARRGRASAGILGELPHTRGRDREARPSAHEDRRVGIRL